MPKYYLCLTNYKYMMKTELNIGSFAKCCWASLVQYRTKICPSVRKTNKYLFPISSFC